ncbi:MAG TPA: hypothetical protein VGW38_20825 [Chloroflexota bacterium]|nr:hypothetical protein [Chloroflexota bacterium]
MSDERGAGAVRQISWRDWLLGSLALVAAALGVWDLLSSLRRIFLNSEPVVPVGAAVLLMLAASLWRGTTRTRSEESLSAGLARTGLFVALLAGLVLGLPWVLSLLF